ncbi:RWD-domain-containing protein [Hysterangium stoloniferum]|nr:RWD-domain-containing protein [Hysterangium stoloniferum]
MDNEIFDEFCKDLQEEEWKILEATYPDTLPASTPIVGQPFTLKIGVEMEKPIFVHLETEGPSHLEHTAHISRLPPLCLTIVLPPSYPNHEPPHIHSLTSEYGWLPSESLNLLTGKLLEMWDNGSTVLALWILCIRNGQELLESLDFLPARSQSISLRHQAPHKLIPSLIAYNAWVLDANFQKSKFECPVCLERLLGSKCISLSSCGHVACRKCLREGWSLYIAEGASERVCCPYPECVKDLKQSPLVDIQAILSPHDVARLQWLQRKKEVEQDPTIVYCPQIACQQPVKRESPLGGDRRPEWDHLRICQCGFAFCVYCRRAWHGPHRPCALSFTVESAKAYLAYPEDSEQRRAIEQKHGKGNILKLLAKYKEDELNQQWMEKEAVCCPGCKLHVQKSMGCNHMTCIKCGQHFCYRCGSKLNATDPYAHFKTKGHSCYSKLFDEEWRDEDDAFIEIEGLHIV